MPGDELLLQRTAAGDGAALAALYDRYAPRVYGLALKFLGKPHDAEDVLQDVFVELPRRATSYNDALGSAESWILMLARSRAIDRVRKNRRDRERLQKIDPPRAEHTPSRSASHADDDNPHLAPDHDWMRSLLDALPVELRDVVQLAYAGGYTREQIAELLDMPTGTVKTRLRAAVRTLAAHLARSQSSPAPQPPDDRAATHPSSSPPARLSPNGGAEP